MQNAAAKRQQAEEITALVDLNKRPIVWESRRSRLDGSRINSTCVFRRSGPTYKVRDRVPIKVHVTRADGGQLPGGTEVAIAAVDAALLELAPNRSWICLAP